MNSKSFVDLVAWLKRSLVSRHLSGRASLDSRPSHGVPLLSSTPRVPNSAFRIPYSVSRIPGSRPLQPAVSSTDLMRFGRLETRCGQLHHAAFRTEVASLLE
jgi:hypothetical protein